jgi:anti-sigma regulatory factor (Ser/Thr protein kinase)
VRSAFTTLADPSQVAEARRAVKDVGRRLALPAAKIEQAALAVTELATNLLKHAGGGHIYAGPCDDAGGSGLEIMALDRGGGMADPGRCLQDGYSTAGSPGTGLGAVHRLSDTMEFYTRAGQGCVIMARFIVQQGSRALPRLGSAVAPYPGELVCGDAWSCRGSAQGRTIVLADGSGHGIEAARAADLAVRVFADSVDASCEAIVERMHHALAPTRGAALAVARIDHAARVIRFVGVGNISAVLLTGGEARHMVSHNGTAGHVAPRIREFTYPFSGEPTVILHSDGLTSRWSLAAYPGLIAHHPSLIAGVLLRDHRRARDDASVVVLRGTA